MAILDKHDFDWLRTSTRDVEREDLARESAKLIEAVEVLTEALRAIDNSGATEGYEGYKTQDSICANEALEKVWGKDEN